MTIETKQMAKTPTGGAQASSAFHRTPPRKRLKAETQVARRNNRNNNKCPGILTPSCTTLNGGDTSSSGSSNNQVDILKKTEIKGLIRSKTDMTSNNATPSPSLSSTSNNSNNTVSEDVAPSSSDKPTTKRGTKRKTKAMRDASPDSGLSIVPCRKSKRLLFKNTRKTIAEQKIGLVEPESDSISPYGRLVELFDPNKPEMDRTDFLTKCLFLGTLDLTLKDHIPGNFIKPKSNKDCKSISRPSSSTLNKKVYNVQSLKRLCIVNIVKKLKHEFIQKEVEYFSRVQEPDIIDDYDDGYSDNPNSENVISDNLNSDNANSDIGNFSDTDNSDIANSDTANSDTTNSDIANSDTANSDIVNLDTDNSDPSWFNFGEYMENLIKTDPPAAAASDNQIPLKECIRKLQRCNTLVTLSSSRKSSKNAHLKTQRLGSITTGNCEGEWCSWKDQMIRVQSTMSTEADVGRDMGIGKQKSRKAIHRRKHNVPA